MRGPPPKCGCLLVALPSLMYQNLFGGNNHARSILAYAYHYFLSSWKASSPHHFGKQSGKCLVLYAAVSLAFLHRRGPTRIGLEWATRWEYGDAHAAVDNRTR